MMGTIMVYFGLGAVYFSLSKHSEEFMASIRNHNIDFWKWACWPGFLARDIADYIRDNKIMY